MSDDGELTMEQVGLFAPGERDRINRYIAAELLAWADDMDPGPNEPGMDVAAVAMWDVRRFWAGGLRVRAAELSPPNPDDRAEIEARLAELRGERT